jgi:uncharacterized membrane protein (DUF106 family)
MDWLINFVQAQPLLSVIIFSLAITSLLTFVYRKLTDQKRMKEIKDKQKELQAKLKGEQDKEKIMEANKEMMSLSSEMLKMSFKPMLITFLPLIIIFTLLRSLYNTADVGNIIAWGTNLPIVGDGAGWFLCYIGFGFIFSLILNKLLKNF